MITTRSTLNFQMEISLEDKETIHNLLSLKNVKINNIDEIILMASKNNDFTLLQSALAKSLGDTWKSKSDLETGNHAIHWAIINNNMDVLTLLCENKADLTVRSKDCDPILDFVLKINNRDLILYLLHIVNSVPKEIGNHLLTAVKLNDDILFDALTIKLDSSKNNEDTWAWHFTVGGNHAIHLAVKNNNVHILSEVLRLHAKHDVLNHNNQTALDLAREQQSESKTISEENIKIIDILENVRAEREIEEGIKNNDNEVKTLISKRNGLAMLRKKVVNI